MEDSQLTEADLEAMEARCSAATKGPWESFVEGRDHTSGSSFIRTGGLDDSSPDIELLGGATDANQDFIAHPRQDVPRLIEEVRRLRAILSARESTR